MEWANPSVVSPLGRRSKGGTHSRTGSWGSHAEGAAIAAGAAAGAAGRGAAVVGPAGLEPPAREREERCTRGRKAQPRVFTMLEPEKEKKWRGGASETRNKDVK